MTGAAGKPASGEPDSGPALPGARISRRTAEIATALVTGTLGAIAVVGAREHGIGWSDAGPEAGTFPFCVGILIVLGSLGTLVQALLLRGPPQPFLDGLQARRVATFFLPILAFVTASVWLGLYLATAIYLAGVMWLQGGYRLIVAIGTGIGVAVFFYVLLETWFQVGLLKGPLEAALGLH